MSIDYLNNDYSITIRDFGDGSETVERGGGANPGFRNHSTTNERFTDVINAAANKLKEKLEQELKGNPTPPQCDPSNPKSNNTQPSRTYELEELIDDKSLLYIEGVGVNEGAKKWEFGNTLAGGLGQYGDPNGTLFPDRRWITGKIVVDWLGDTTVKISSLDFKFYVFDGFDFDPGNTDVFTPNIFNNPIGGIKGTIGLKGLRFLEKYNHAYDVALKISWIDQQERTKVIELSPPEPSNEPCCEGDRCIPKPQSYDPNDILGPNGFGDENWIVGNRPFNYTIRFENDPELATAPAQVVRITQKLDTDLDFRTFRVGDFGFGDITVDVPDNQAIYQTRLDLTASKGIFVDVMAGIDVAKGEAYWNFTAIDPTTGEIPTNPLLGFLPPNEDGIEGQGFANYTIKAKKDIPTGTVIDATAEIVFDINEPILTPAIFNTLDIHKPTSTVEALPATSDTPEFLVQWSGTDQGSALANYTIYVSENSGEFTTWLQNTTLTEATYTGQAGRAYAFYAVAIDNAGNVEEIPITPDATTRVAGGTTTIGDFVWLDLNANGIQDSGEPGLQGVTVNLYSSGATNITATATTNTEGFYNFTNVTPGEYSIEFIAPTGYTITLQDQGSDNTKDSDANSTTGKTAIFSANAGDGNLTIDAGFYQFGSISGQKWHDLDADGVKDTGEIGLQGWTIYLDSNTNGQLDNGETFTTTDANGNYNFLNLRPGTYTVAEVMQEGWRQTYPSIGVTTTASSTEIYTPSVSTTIASSLTTTPASLINLDAFRSDSRFADIDGSGLTTVVIDTGIDINHPFFGSDANGDGVSDRIIYQYDFADNDNDASDKNGHGSHIASIAASVAPNANIIALKVFKDNGSGYFSDLEKALQWVNQNAITYNIASVNLSLGDSQNWNTANPRYGIGDELAALANQGIIVAAAAGNSFYQFNSNPGLAYPAADPNTIAVGAVWADNFGNSKTFIGGAIDYTTGTDHIASFSQRHPTLLDVFAPGILITGANATGGTQAMGGTSQAVPFISGITVLAQQIAQEKLGRQLTVSEFRNLLDNTSSIINDGDDESDNVTNTGLNFPRVNMLALAEGILNLNSQTTNPGNSNPNANSNDDPLYLPSSSVHLSHTVTLSSGQIANNIDFGNQRLNNAPEVQEAIADQTATEDTAFSFTLPGNIFNDIDAGDILTYSATLENGSALPSWLTFDAATLTFSGTPTNDHVGILNVKVIATDKAGGTVSDTFTLTVENVNNAPTVANPIADKITTEDETFSFTFSTNTFNDVDPGNEITYSATLENGNALPTWLTFDAETRTFNGTPTNSDVGSLNIKVTATDNEGKTVSDTFTLTVENVNDTPTVTDAISSQTAIEDTNFTFIIPENTFADIDTGDILTYSATLENGDALPSWLTFNTTTRTLNGTPTNSDVGSLNIKVTATDNFGASANDLFTLSVANTNDAPILVQAIADQTAREGTIFSFILPANTFSDIDADDIRTYSATLENGNALPSWLTFNAATRTFSGTPTNSDVGSFNVQVIVTDTSGATANDIFSITVNNVNDEESETLISGTPGNDTLISPTDFPGENNRVFTGFGDDQVDVSLSEIGNNRIFTGTGEDTIYAGKSDRAFGGSGNDTFYAIDGQGGNRMSGGAGNDTFYLGSNDRALGGAGNDIFYVETGGGNLISGGAGADQFWIVNAELPEASNTIIDFQRGTDVIGINGAVSLGITTSTLQLNQIGADTAISFNNQTLAVLTGIQASSLNLTNTNQFILA